MSWQAYNDFIALARDVYDLDLQDARHMYSYMRDDLDRVPEVEDLFTEEAGLFMEDEEPEEDYELFGPDDEWVEAGEEVEVTADLAYEDRR